MKREEQIVKASKDAEKQMGLPEGSSSYGIGFIDGVLWADKHPDLYSVTRKAAEKEREYMINKFCEFMQSCEGYVVSGEKCNYDNFMKFIGGTQ